MFQILALCAGSVTVGFLVSAYARTRLNDNPEKSIALYEFGNSMISIGILLAMLIFFLFAWIK
jgi:hypothetical protein